MIRVLCVVSLWLFAVAAHAQFPSRPVKIIVPFPPGQGADIGARLLADGLTNVWKQQVVVENRAGGGGVPGMLAGKDAPADGHTITIGTSGTVGVNPGLYKKLAYDPFRDFAMVHGLFFAPLIIVANPGAPYKTLRDLLDAAKKNPGKIQWALPGNGTAQHLTGELLKFHAGVDIVPVFYKGSGPAMTDLLGGQVILMIDTLASSLPHIRAGKLRPLAMTGAERVPQVPDVPTVAEQGFPGFDGIGWSGLLVPKATPPDIVSAISGAANRVLTDPSMQARFIERALIADARGAKEWAEFVKLEMVKWAEVIRKANLREE